MENRVLYIVISIVLLLIEFLIERFFKNGFVRYYLGDVFVVILIYTSIKSFKPISATKLAIPVLIFSYCVEFLQYIDIVSLIGATKNRFTDIVIGSTFSVLDLISYTIGITCIFIVDYYFIEK